MNRRNFISRCAAAVCGAIGLPWAKAAVPVTLPRPGDPFPEGVKAKVHEFTINSSYTITGYFIGIGGAQSGKLLSAKEVRHLEST